jgi:hypothetical protein
MGDCIDENGDIKWILDDHIDGDSEANAIECGYWMCDRGRTDED